MLSADRFYGAYDCYVQESEHMEILGKQVICYPDRFYIICLERHQDPFNWLACRPDGVVFQTASGYLAIMILFDSEQDETETAITLCNKLIGAE